MSYRPTSVIFARYNGSSFSIVGVQTVNLPINKRSKGLSYYDGSAYFSAVDSLDFITCTDLLLTGTTNTATLFQTRIDGASIDKGYARQASPNTQQNSLSSDDVSWASGTSLKPVGTGLSLTNSSASAENAMMFGMVLS